MLRHNRKSQFHFECLVTISVAILAIACSVSLFAQEQVIVSGPIVGTPVKPHSMSGKAFLALPRSMVVESKEEREQLVIGDQPVPPNVKQLEDAKMLLSPQAPSMMGSMPVTPSAFSAASPNFTGILENGLVPPDTNGAVGPNHYIQIVNTEFAIWDKSGNLLSSGVHVNQLWAGSPTDNCFLNDNGDPVVNYDQLADRFVISQFAIPNGFQGRPTAECVAVSKTSDPVNGGWWLYDFTLNVDHDYPKMGVWPDAYYLTSQQGYSGGVLNAIALDRTNMLAGNSASFQAFTVNSPTVILLPGDLIGTAPPAGTPEFLVRPIDGTIFGGSDRIEIYAFHVDWTIPANSTVTLLTTLTPSSFSSGLCNPGSLFDDCIPQPGTTQLLESLNVWPMGPLQYRNFGSYETLVFNHTVNAGTSATPIAAPRWYELRRPSGGSWAINQQQTFSPDSTHRWMGSVAMDKAGDMALGYSASSGTLTPEIRYVGRLATDPLGQMTTTESTLISGLSSQTGVDRWGDYSAMRVDPADGCTFWYTTEFLLGGANSGLWGTQVGAFRFPTCNPVDLGITKTAPSPTVVAGTNLTYTITVINPGSNAATNVVVTDTLPAGVSLVSTSVSCSNSAGTLTCPVGGLPGGVGVAFNVTIHVPSAGTGSPTITNTASVTSDQLDPNLANNTSSVTTTVKFVADLSITKTESPNPAPAGTGITYTITVSNAGPSDAPNTVVTDTLPAGVNFVNSSPAVCSGTTVLSCNVGTVVNGGTTVLTINAFIPANFLSSINPMVLTGSITNTASVASSATDPNLANNTASVTTKVISVADLELSAVASPNPVHEGTNVVYSVSFINLGPSDAQLAYVNQYIPNAFQLKGVDFEACSKGTSATTCRLGNVVPLNFGLTYHMTFFIPKTFLGTKKSEVVKSQFKIHSSSIDPDPPTFEYATTTVIP